MSNLLLQKGFNHRKFFRGSKNSLEKHVYPELVFEWCKTFREGRESVENMPHNRLPRTLNTPSSIYHANVLLRDNRRIIVKELASSVGSEETIVKHIYIIGK